MRAFLGESEKVVSAVLVSELLVKITLTACAVAALGLGLLGPAATAAPAPVDSTARAATVVPKAVNGTAVKTTLRAAVAHLPVAVENRAGYVRTKFKLWDDVDHDCQNTRAEVLRAETLKKVTGACTVRAGRWHSYYDDLTYNSASRIDIDHVVPLAEAWDSGARHWTAQRREAYANDLADANALMAVSSSSNRSKGDRDPAEWLPDFSRCRYVLQWTIVKVRWSLRVDGAEKQMLRHYAALCPNRTLSTHKASVKLVGKPSSSTGGGTGTGGATTGGTGGGGTDPMFGTCTEAKSHGYGPYVQGVDPEYYWYDDRDHDGVVCE